MEQNNISILKNDKDEAFRKADQIIRNTYRTLMTGGNKGVLYLLC